MIEGKVDFHSCPSSTRRWGYEKTTAKPLLPRQAYGVVAAGHASDAAWRDGFEGRRAAHRGASVMRDVMQYRITERCVEPLP